MIILKFIISVFTSLFTDYIEREEPLFLAPACTLFVLAAVLCVGCCLWVHWCVGGCVLTWVCVCGAWVGCAQSVSAADEVEREQRRA